MTHSADVWKWLKKKAQVATHKIKSRLVWLYNTKGAIHNGVLCVSACYTARRCIHLRGKYAWLQQQSDSEYWNEGDVFLEWNSWKNPSGPRLWKVGNCKYTSISGKPLPVCVAARSLKKTSLALRQCYLLISQTLHFMKTYSDVSLAVGSTLNDVSIQELEFYQQTLPASHSNGNTNQARQSNRSMCCLPSVRTHEDAHYKTVSFICK